MDNSIDARIERAVNELERLCVRLGMFVAAQQIIDAGVDVTRALEKLDAIEPVNNQEYRMRHSVKMEHARDVYMREEAVTRVDIVAARKLLMRLIFRADGHG